ncbi:MAG: hypothetical protein H6737_10020 [Alphaproteobacteria bacterium]|nr:hypothetical protein [Alphaproteobacteria bacterium]
MIWMLGFALAAPCELDGPADAPFGVQAPDDVGRVRVVLVLHLGDTETEVAWGEKVLAALDARGIQAGLSVRVREPSDGLAALVTAAQASGHEVVARLGETQVEANATTGPQQLRKTLKPLTSRFGRLRAAEVKLGNRTGEAVLHRAGLRAILVTNGPATATPRPQLHFEAQPDTGVILPIGPYSGKCGAEPTVLGFTPPAADRVTQATYGARSEGVGIVRLTLEPGSDDDPVVLGRWLDEVAKPVGLQIGPPQAAREAALRALRTGNPDDWDPASTAGGRLVRVDEVVKAAESLRDATAIPRQLDGDLAPTEAYQAFLHLLVGDIEGSVVRLGDLAGPPTLAKSTLTGPTPVDRAALVELAKALHADLPSAIPAALPVDGRLLNAPELLTAMASAVRGDDPVMAVPAAVPEPSADGLGWGHASTP